MSYTDGMMALNLEMPARVPRTEYSVLGHPGLLSKVTGISVQADSDRETFQKAQKIFLKEWNFDFMWSTDILHQIFGEYYTDMGHASYAAGGSDFREVGQSKFRDEEDVLRFDPWEVFGQRDEAEIVDFLNHGYRERCNFWDDAVNMNGVYVTCMSGLIDLFGWDLLLTAAGVDPKGFGDVANRYADWLMQYIRALAKCDSPVIMVHDDIVWTEGPFLHPDWYRKYIFPNYRKYLKPLLEAGKKIMFTSDGNYTAFIDDIAACGFHGFVMEPGTDMAYIAEKYGKTHAFIGNADTRILLLGSKEEIRREVKRCMDIGKKCPGFFMAVGNHIPANTPVDHALWYNEFYEEMAKR
ncbi:MAG: uroporphyrinogen decarboxylase family protein [Candidatus Merdivicinus sp.]|jgi:hypothetical protein